MKFFYDQQLKKCSSFLYHGCGGNDNRFDEENQCINKCLTEISSGEQGTKINLLFINKIFEIKYRLWIKYDSL